MDLVEKHIGTVFSDNTIGKIQTKPIHLDVREDFVPEQPPYRKIPINYQEQVSKLLDFLRKEGVIRDVDPNESYECVLNVVITDKKGGNIRMNIDNTPMNPGLKRTRMHVQTPQEIRHKLKEAQVFTEMDMGWGYHQLEIDETAKNRAIFQTHEGLHRMERLFFRSSPASVIFHNEVNKIFQGMAGIETLHDNILVTGKDTEEHRRNLQLCLDQCKKKGITLKLSKSSFCLTQVKWFGRIFTGHGVSRYRQD